MISRRNLLRAMGSFVALGANGSAVAQNRTIKVLTHANILHVHVPGATAISEVFPTLGPYTVELRRFEKLQELTRSLIAGDADICYTDTTTVMAATSAGADLRIIGQLYSNVDLAFCVNADKINTLQDLTKSDVIVGVNSTGDITHAIMVAVLNKYKIDIKRVRILGLGGSSSRMRALLSGRVHCVPVHADQAAALAKQGNFKVLIKPWTEFEFFSNEIWVVRADWLKVKGNQRVAVDVLKAQLIANGKANADFAWYVDRYRKFSTDKAAASYSDAEINDKWVLLRNEVKSWPVPMTLIKSDYAKLLPSFQLAGVPTDKVDINKLIDDSFLKQAQKELEI